MEANEIMIGDLLRVTKDVCIKKGIIVRVRAIDADDSLPKMGLKGAIRCQPIDDEYGMNIGGVWADFLEPIPLTAEILEKNGFHEQKWNDLATEFVFATDLNQSPQTVIQFTFYSKEIEGVRSLLKMWTKSKFGHGQNDVHLCGIYYVHELQHALRLCGIDKEIIL